MANKFKKRLVTQVKKDIAWNQTQEELQNKYHLKKDVVVVEKANMTKFVVKIVTRFIKTMATIALLSLAIIGLLSLIYPETRKGLVDIYLQTLSQLHSFTGI